jgi:hypothetical protein
LLPPPLVLVAHLPVIEYAEDSHKKWMEAREMELAQMGPLCRCTTRGMGLSAAAQVVGNEGVVEKTIAFLKEYGVQVSASGSARGHARPCALALLRQLEKTGSTSPWLERRRIAFERSQGLIRAPWPPPSVYDYLPVCVDHHTGEAGTGGTDWVPPRIEVRSVNPELDADLGNRPVQTDNM